MTGTLEDGDWHTLLQRIAAKKCTPFLGAGACHGVLPLGSKVAANLAEEYDYPLEDRHDLARVAQYIAVGYDALFPKERIADSFKNVPAPDFASVDEPHALLADLNLPVYVTTNYDDFMYKALEDRRRRPRRELCHWHQGLERTQKSVFALDSSYVPDESNPVVFHLHGHVDVPESLVLTEDDYLDFLKRMSENSNLLPPRIQQAFTGASLLFLGYSISDWDFRVLFRSLVSSLAISQQRAHVSVQLAPGGEALSGEQRTKMQQYLDRYFGQLHIRVYWGTCREFAIELRQRWDAFQARA